jgi:hypothetical protein
MTAQPFYNHISAAAFALVALQGWTPHDQRNLVSGLRIRLGRRDRPLSGYNSRPDSLKKAHRGAPLLVRFAVFVQRCQLLSLN